MRKVFAIDIDKTITLDSSWTDEQVIKAKPNKRMIALVNTLYSQNNIIILYTCRGDSIIPATKYWLKKHGVKYHSINNNKLWCDYYVDDRALSPNEFIYGKFGQVAGKKKHKVKQQKDRH